MSFNSTTRRMPPYVGNSSALEFSFTFKIRDRSHLSVTVLRVADLTIYDLDVGTDFLVSGVGEDAGGSITLRNSAQAWLDASGFLATGFSLFILGATTQNQTASIKNQGPTFNPVVIENQFDKLAMVDQEQQDAIDRSVKLPVTLTSVDFNPTLPADIVTNGGGKVPVLNALGTAWAAASAWVSLATINAAISAVGTTAASAAAAAASAVTAAASVAAAAVSAAAAAASAVAAAASAAAAAGTAGTPFQESLVGTFAAGNTTYPLTHPPVANATLLGFLGISIQTQNVDYTIAGQTVTFIGIDTSAQNFLAYYRF